MTYSRFACWLSALLALTVSALAQTPPGAAELQAYRGLHAAAAKGDVTEIETLVKSGSAIDARDGRARTPLHVAAFMRKPDAARTLMRLGADANALEAQKYDIVTIAAVADDMPMLQGGQHHQPILRHGADRRRASRPRRGRAHIDRGESAARSCQQSRLDRGDR